MSSLFLRRLREKEADLPNAVTPTVAFFGDSVTQGCFECYERPGKRVETVFEQNHSYGARFGEILNLLFPRSPVNLIFGGVSGDNAHHALKRLENDVLSHKPDLVIVAFALNDCCRGPAGLSEYVGSLTKIFTAVEKTGADCIFLTPNDMCDHLSDHLAGDPFFEGISASCANAVKSGWLSLYVSEATKLAEEYGVAVCPVYDEWIKMKEAGVNTTELLANKLNHPVRPLCYMTAWKLIETLLDMQ